jgi:radical SAM superfamily enzyme YgiQ (UPF0313 family)
MKPSVRPHVALVRPRDFQAVPPGAPVQDPLGVGYLAAVLRRRSIDVVVVDAHSLSLDDDGIVSCLKELRPAVVGISLHSFSDYEHCVSISRGIFSMQDRPYCVWGGEHATFHAELILRKHSEVDAVVLGEGEITFPELVERQLEMRLTHSQKEMSFELVRGAVLRGADGQPVNGGFRETIADLDQLPEPHKDVVELALQSNKPVTLSLLTGRGCTHRCRFCTAHEFLRLGGGAVWRRRSPQGVADELEHLVQTYLHHELVHPVVQFQDVIFLGTSPASRRWAHEFVDELEYRSLKAPFYCMTRADSIIANQDLLPRLVDVGLWSVEVGIESGVDRILSSYNKLNSAADNELAVHLLRTHGITYDASGYIMFDPSMSLDELRANALYLARFGAATWDFFVTRLQLYPGTALREEMIQKGLFDGAHEIGRTSGYAFSDSRVGMVAEHAYYYHPSIRTLDLALRDAKAVLAQAVRRGAEPNRSVVSAVELVHATYCRHLLDLIDMAEAGTIEERSAELVAKFLVRVHKLTELLRELLSSKLDLSSITLNEFGGQPRTPSATA